MQICIEICIITGALYSKCVSVIEMPLSFCRMPKTALEAKEWERKLKNGKGGSSCSLCDNLNLAEGKLLRRILSGQRKKPRS